jgi:hypothetical protein
LDLDWGKVAEHELFSSDSYTTKGQERQSILSDRDGQVAEEVVSRPRLEGEGFEVGRASAEPSATLSEDPLIAIMLR